MQVTSLEQLKNIKKTEIVELPCFEDGTPFIAELKRPNVINLICTGKMPNSLLKIATDMFSRGLTETEITKKVADAKGMQEVFNMLTFLAKESLVNPTYAQLEELGITLGVEQLNAILSFTQGGVKALENFRKQQGNSKSSKSSN